MAKISFYNKTLFEIVVINGEKFIKKEDKEASKKAGSPVFVMMPINELISLSEVKEKIILK